MHARRKDTFEDDKSEIGLDQYEGRRYLGLKRHLLLSAVSYLFLARVRQEWVEKESGADSLPTAHGNVRSGPILGVVVTPSEAETGGESRKEDHLAQRRNAQARKSHAKRTRRRLRELGIKLTELQRCCWDTTYAL